MNPKKIEPFIEYYEEQQKAIDQAVWLNFKHRIQNQHFGVLDAPEDQFAVANQLMLEDLEMEFHYPLPEDYTKMSFEQIQKIRSDEDPLSHWENLVGMFSVADGELLRFILKHKIQLKKIIRYELASRGHDENHQWVGFDKAKEIWLKE
ncbi:hypothetical protein [Chryseobacterium sp. EO14]|uniref:hypothetical protein n=1 Tax=Chryseobacterium sp. EO14 TaxID=2950551 RepID=UPI0021097199|nr:hypothetical protein [Chryseobacterium sp. EO14]MCQ4138792.1 hypothetical protein [Chryseobacterium sp. EO14]